MGQLLLQITNNLSKSLPKHSHSVVEGQLTARQTKTTLHVRNISFWGKSGKCESKQGCWRYCATLKIEYVPGSWKMDWLLRSMTDEVRKTCIGMSIEAMDFFVQAIKDKRVTKYIVLLRLCFLKLLRKEENREEFKMWQKYVEMTLIFPNHQI